MRQDDMIRKALREMGTFWEGVKNDFKYIGMEEEHA
jgi:hypothetical protein